MHKAIKALGIFGLCPILMLSACAPKVKSKSHEADDTVSSAPISSTQGGTVALKDGSQVVIPAEALPFDGQVTMEKVPTPAELAAAESDSASAAVAISAVGTDGAPIEQTLQPMKISIVLSQESALTLTTGGRAEDLCALVTTKGQKLFVWRASSIEPSTGSTQVSFDSKLFGTYQLAYCGLKPLSGFANPRLAGFVDGTKVESKIEIPTGFGQGLGPHGQYCLALVQKGLIKCSSSPPCQSGTEALMTTVVPSTESAQTLSLSFVPEGLNPKAVPYLQLYLMDSATGCPFRHGDLVDSSANPTNIRSVYDFALSKKDLSQGVAGVLGEEGPFKLGLLSLFVGGPGDASVFPTFDKPSVCVTWDVSDKASASHVAKITDGKWQGVGELEMPIALGAQGTDQAATLSLRIGATCGAPNSSFDKTFKSLEPYTLVTNVSGSVYLTPVTLGLVVSDGRYQDQKACLEVRDRASGERFANLPLVMKSQDIQVYLPHPKVPTGGQPAYNFRFVLIGDEKSCDVATENLPKVEKNGVILKSRMDLSL